MRILAVDPGSDESAYVLFDCEGEKILLSAIVPNPKLRSVMECEWADWLVIEQIRGYGKRVGNEVFDTCEWTGRFMEMFDGPCAKVPRMRVKAACAKALDGTPEGYGVSHSTVTDKEVRAWMIQRFGEVGTKKKPGPLYGFKNDMFAALAVAVTYADGPRPE